MNKRNRGIATINLVLTGAGSLAAMFAFTYQMFQPQIDGVSDSEVTDAKNIVQLQTEYISNQQYESSILQAIAEKVGASMADTTKSI